MSLKNNISGKARNIWKSKIFKVSLAGILLGLAIASIFALVDFQNSSASQYSTANANCLAENQAFYTSDQQSTSIFSDFLTNTILGCDTGEPPADTDCEIENTATATGDNINVVVSNSTNNSIDCETDYAIGIQKTPSAYLFEIDQAAPENTDYTYYLDYGNSETTPLTNVVITDVLDPRIEYVPSTCSGNCVYDAGTRTLTWTIGSLQPNQVGRVAFGVNFAAGYNFDISETIPNTAVITSTEVGPDQDSAFVNIRFTNPDINITKTTDPIYYDLGEQVIYDIGFENTSAQALTGVYITDQLDARLNFTSCTGGCTYDVATRTVRWEIGDLAIGASAQRFLTVTTQGTGVINNEATIFSNETQPDFDDINIIVETQFESEIKIIKSASEATVRRGDVYTYTLNYFNPSDDTALTGVVITDQLVDQKIDYVLNSCSDNCAYDAGTETLTWAIGDLAIGETGQVTFNVQTTDNAALEPIFNTATIDSNETDPDDDSAIVDIIDYAIGIQKTPSAYNFEIDENAPENTSYTYFLNYTNNEATPLTNVVITDTLDTRIEYVSNTCIGAVSCTYDTNTRTISWAVGTLPANASAQVEFQVNFAAGYTFIQNESVPNTAIITSTEAGPDQDSAYVNVRFTNPDINITKDTDPIYYDLGDEVIYDIGFENTSAQALTGVYITDQLDPRLNFTSCTGGCTYTPATRTVRWEIGDLAIGASAQRFLTVTTQGIGVINNEATIFSNETQPDFDDVNIIVETQFENDIKIVKYASESTVRRGDVYKYTLDYFNPSDDTALTGVVITDVLTDTKIDYVANSCSNACTYDAGTRTLSWAIGDLAIGATGTVTFDVIVDANAALETIFNEAVIDSNETDEDRDAAIVDIIDYAIGIQKTPSAYLFEIAPANPELTSYTYFLDYVNTEATPLTNTVITDTLDNRIDYIANSCSAGCTYDAVTRTLTWNLGTLAPNSAGRVEFQVNFAAGYVFTANEGVPNTAIINSTEAGPDQDNAYVNVRFLNPDINITKNTDPVYYDLGDEVVYEIFFENTSTQNLTGVYILDVLEPRLGYSSCTGGCTYDPVTRTVRWDIGNLNVGESATEYLSVVTQGTGVINNESTIFSNETQPDFDDVNIIVETQFENEVKIVKTASEATVRRTDTYKYTLDYSNPSDDTALTGVVITDQLTDTKIDYVANSCSNSCTYDAGTRTLTWTIGDLSIGANGTVTFDVIVDQNAPLEAIFNEAVIDSNETDPDSDVAIVDIIDFDIFIQKTPSAYLFEIDQNAPENTSYTYFLDYGNSNDTTQLTNAVITDTLDNRIDYVANSCTGGCTYDAGTRTITWTVGTIAPLETGRFQFDVTFAAGYSFTNNESVPNTAIITSTEAGPDQDNAYVNVRFTNPDIDIQKTTDPIYYDEGDQVIYEIPFQNTSAQTLTGVYITDVLDPRLNYVSCTGGCTYSAGTRTVRWEIGEMAPGATATRFLTVAVQGIGVINNQATIFSNETQPDFDDVNIIITTEEFEINILKDASRSRVRRDDTYTYTLDYSNPSDDTALTQVVITDVLTDTKIDYVANSCSNSCTYDAGTRTLTWNVGNLAIGATGQVTFDVTVDSAAPIDVIYNEATIDSAETDPDTDAALVEIIEFGIDITKTASETFFRINPFNPAGTSYTYTVDYTNPEAQALTGVVLSDILDPRIDYVANSCSNSCTYDAGTRTLTWTIGDLAALATGQVTFDVEFVNTYTYSEAEIIPNVATIDSNETDPIGDNVDVEVQLLAYSTSIVKDASVSQTRRGDTYTYTVDYANTNTESTLTGVTLTDILTDTKIDYVDGSCSDSCAYDAGTRTLSWAIGTLAPSATGSVTFDVIVATDAAFESINNVATIDSNETDPEDDNAIVEILAYDLTLEKTASGTSFAINPSNPAATSYIYTLNYGNPEVNPLTNVVLTDTLDARIEYVANSCTNNCTYDAGTRTLTWNIGTLAAQTTGQVTFAVNFNDTYTFTEGEIIPNTAIIDSEETDQIQSSVDVAVTLLNPGIGIVKTSDKTIYDLNESVTYTLDYINDGDVALTGVVITDILEARLEYLSCSGAVCNYNATNRTLQFDIGNLAVNQGGSLTFVARAIGTGTIDNTAVIDSNETPAEDDDAVIQVTTPDYQVNIIKTASRSVVERSDTYTYTLAYQNNTASADLTNVVISDILTDTKIDYVANSCSNSCTYDAGTRTLAWTIGTLTPGQQGIVTFDVTVGTNAALETIDNTATIDSEETPPVEDDEEVEIEEYDIAITKTSSESIVQVDNTDPTASSYRYTLDYENSADTALTNVVVTDVLTDTKIDYVANSCSNSCTYDAGTRTLSWNIGNLAIGATGQVTFDVTLADRVFINGEIINNTATIDSTETPPADDDDTVLVAAPQYEIGITKTVDDTSVTLNQELTYTVDYNNPSALTALTGVVITDVLESRLDYVTNSCSNSCTYDAASRTLSWNIGSLAASANGQVTFRTTVNSIDQDTIPNTATIDSNETDPEDSTVIVTVIRYDLTLDKTASEYLFTIDRENPDTTSWTYYLDYSNQSNAAITNVVLTDELPSELTYIVDSCSDNCTYNSTDKTLVWNIGALQPQAAGRVSFQVRLVDQEYNHEQYITNPANITSNETEQVDDEVDVQIVFYDLIMNKVVNKNSVNPGDTLIYTINYQVPATFGDLTSVVITDTLDEDLTYQVGSCISCSYNSDTRTLTWNLGTVAPGTSKNVFYTAIVNSDAPAGVIPNLAIIDSNETDPIQDIVEVTVVTTIITGAFAITIFAITIGALLAFGIYRASKSRKIKA